MLRELTQVNENGMLMVGKLSQELHIVNNWCFLLDTGVAETMLFHQEPPDVSSLCLGYTCAVEIKSVMYSSLYYSEVRSIGHHVTFHLNNQSQEICSLQNTANTSSDFTSTTKYKSFR